MPSEIIPQEKLNWNCRVGFLPVAGFSMLSLSSGIEPLREANRLSGKPLYEWSVYAVEGQSSRSSCGIEIPADQSIDDGTVPNILFVVGGFNPLDVPEQVYAWLRSLKAYGTSLGGISTGAFILAQAGLLNGYRATTHWEDAAAAVEQYPNVTWTGALFEQDRDRMTCSGCSATLDMLLNLILRDHGHELCSRVSNQFQHERVRSSVDEQSRLEQQRLHVKCDRVLAGIKIMEENLEESLPLDEIAARIYMSRRQLERRFKTHTGQSPAEFYRNLRLSKARTLLIRTNMPIIEVAVACGFTSLSHFTKSYRMRFSVTPREERFQAV